jgi:hypothetical protein
VGGKGIYVAIVGTVTRERLEKQTENTGQCSLINCEVWK